MDDYIIKLVQWNFIGVSSLLTLFMFMQSDLTFDKQARRYFTFTGFSVILLIVFDSIAMYFEGYNDNTDIQKLHTFIYVICYAVKPMIVMFLLFIVLRKSRQTKLFYWIPSMINMIAAWSALFCPIVFSYQDHNIFHRGPLGYTAHIMALFYAILIVNESLKRFKDKSYYEGATVIWILIMTMIATLLDSEVNTRLVNSVSAMCLLLYYFYFYFQLSKCDIATGVFNRNAYYADVLRFEKQISALMLFNMNELNPSQGPDSIQTWESSLMSMNEIINRNVPPASRMYRISGDEIAVLCISQSKDVIRFSFDKIKKDMKSSDYLFASGLAFNDRHNGTDELLSRANDAMRIDRSNIRAGRIFRQRMLAAAQAAEAENEFPE